MQRRNLSDRIIKLDRNIRFVGVVNSRGEVIEGGFQHGVQPLLEGTDEQQMYIQSLSNMTMFQNYSDRLGARKGHTHDFSARRRHPLCVGVAQGQHKQDPQQGLEGNQEKTSGKKKKKKKPTK
jgi:hypothetical protein